MLEHRSIGDAARIVAGPLRTWSSVRRRRVDPFALMNRRAARNRGLEKKDKKKIDPMFDVEHYPSHVDGSFRFTTNARKALSR